MQTRHYIDGQWISPEGRQTCEVINPATNEKLADTVFATPQEIERAITAAQTAFLSWRQVPTLDRCQYLFKFKSLLETHFEELVQLCTKEHGKTLVESRGDVRRGIQMVETACGMPTLMMGKHSEDIAAGIDCHAIKRPMGVFAGVTPFNFPAMVPFWFWPFAVASGNTFVLKPSERVPLSQMRIFEILEKTGLPKGVMNLVNGGKEVVEALCTHPLVKGISFVGSTPVAKIVYETATKHGKRVQALGGAKNFMVVLPDAVLDPSARTALESIIGCAGQRCLAGSVVISVGTIAPEIEKRIVALASDISVGDGSNPATQMGPLISKAAVDRVTGLIQSAESEGAKILLDGRKKLEGLKGCYLRPTVITGVTPEMRIAKEEVFGPVVCLANVKTLDEAIQWINKSPFGNTTTLFTSSGAAARKFSYEVDPSMIGINIGVPAPMSFFSFGGSKDSFFGDLKAHGMTGVEFYTDTKVTIQRWNKESSIW